MTPGSASAGPAGDVCLRCGSELATEAHDVAACDRARADAGLAPVSWWATCPRCGRLLFDPNRRARALHRRSDCDKRLARLDSALETRPARFDPMTAGF